MIAVLGERFFRLSKLGSKLTKVASKWVLPALLCAFIGTCASAANNNRYNQVMQLVRAMSDSQKVRMLPFGKSFTAGYCVPAMLITDFSENSANKTRILVCSGQHGNEFDAIRSILSLSCNLASGANPDVLKKCEFIIIPMVNPTGVAAHTRLSSDNVDLNRNWRDPFSPEALHVDALIKTWRPHLLIDAHEQDKPSKLEVPYCLSGDQQMAMNKLAADASVRTHIPLARAGSNKSLFHSNYAFLGYGAYLIETDKNLPYQKKYKLYSMIILGMAREISDGTIRGGELSPSSRDFAVSAVSPFLTPIAKKSPISPFFNIGVILIVGYGICVWLLKPNRRKTKWSHLFVKCEVDESLPSTRLELKQILIPITHRSWVNRRLRQRYVTPKEEPQKPEPKAAEAGLTFIKPKYATRTQEPSRSLQPNP